MNLKTGIGKEGVAIAIALAFAMCIISYIFRPVEILPIQYGICLDSPDSWKIPSFLSWLLNTAFIGLIAFMLYLINRNFNFIRTTEPALTVVFIIMAASSPWFTQKLNTSTILCLANIISMGIIFEAYETRNATRQMFTLGAIAGVGSMFQYAFLPMACVYLLWGLFMKILRFKELLAFFIGLICPYWICLGLGWIHFHEFHFPSLVALFDTSNDHSDIIFLLVGIGIATIAGFLIALVNGIKLFAGNSRVNAMNLCVTVLGVATLICILADYENIPAYVITLYMFTAIQVANICALWHVRYPWTLSVIPAAVFILLFIGNMLL